MRSGVYAITHLDSARVYIGSSVNVPRRWSSHRRDLRRGTHPNRYRIGSAQQGTRNHGAKLSDESVVEICRRLATGEPGRHIARSFGVHESIVSEIKSGRRWAHVQADLSTNP